MVIGEKEVKKGPQPAPPPSSIDNIMSGISNTGAVKMNNHRKKLRQRFDIIKKLGQGTYGKVQLGINKETGQEVAIKTIKKCKIETDADLIRIRREVQIMSSVQHPNIIHIYEVFENREKMVLVMEFAAGGELYDYLSERKVLSEEEARRVFRQISTAVYYCHKHKICHRDLKLENILLDENGNAKIADFGLSNVFDDQRLLATFCGSPLYASPEIVKGTPYQGPEVDCWSLGVLLYTLVYGAMPFDGSNFKRLVKQISAGDYYEPKKPSPASPLIREMLTVCPKQRATIEQICNHWWVNEGYHECCLDLAEELANQTPVRLDVLLSLAPTAVTSDQLVVPGPIEDGKQPVPRSHSVGSICDIAKTEAERRIIDMVAAGGEAALAPSPTRNITPMESPAQVKRKLETTISSEAVIGGSIAGNRKRDKPEDLQNAKADLSISEVMDIGEENRRELAEHSNNGNADRNDVVGADSQSIIKDISSSTLPEVDETLKPNTFVPESKASHSSFIEEMGTEDEAVGGHVDAQKMIMPNKNERQNSLPDDENKPNTERRRSRIFEAAEKFEGNNSGGVDKPKKIVIPGVSVGSFKKEFERKASLTALTTPPPTGPTEKRLLINSDSIEQAEPLSQSHRGSTANSGEGLGRSASVEETLEHAQELSENKQTTSDSGEIALQPLAQSDSKSSTLSLEEARRSMENSIALLNQAKTESNSDVDQLCAKTESVAVSVNDAVERQKKLKSAREIIGNAIPIGKIGGIGVRKPPVPFGINGRSISGSVVPSSTTGLDRKPAFHVSTPPDPRIYERESPLSIHTAKPVAFVPGPAQTPNEEDHAVKVSHAEITLKSATLPRRKVSHGEAESNPPTPRAEIPTRFGEQRNQPSEIRKTSLGSPFQTPYSPVYFQSAGRATSLEPQFTRSKEHYIPIQRPGSGFSGPASASQQSVGPPLSRQSTVDSDLSDTQTTNTQSTATLNSGTSQPIKKSPREFIIPIAVEGGGYVTPRAGSLEPSDASQASSFSTFSRLGGRRRKFGNFFMDRDSEEESGPSPFNRMHRHTSIGRESDSEDPSNKFTYRLRSSRPNKKVQQADLNDSASSGEEDDEDGFEILTAENLFSTLLSRVRALTNRLNVNNDSTSGFPSPRFMNNLRQTHSPFWHHDPFSSRLNSSGAWRHSMSRDLGTDIDSIFSSRTGATLPRDTKCKSKSKLPTDRNKNTSNVTDSQVHNQVYTNVNNNNEYDNNHKIDANSNSYPPEKLDLADLDLSQLRLTKKDLETLSSLTPELPKHYQDQLLAQLPPEQARKLSRTLSMQTSKSTIPRVYKRSLSGSRDITPARDTTSNNYAYDKTDGKLGERARSVNPDESIASSIAAHEFDRNTIMRRSLSRGRCIPTTSRLAEPNSRFSYSGDIKLNDQRCSIPDYRVHNPKPPPSGGCLSPPPLDLPDSTVRRRSLQRRISRFLRPDFFDGSSSAEDNCVLREKRERERETQSVLREIRERSRERSRDRAQREWSADPSCLNSGARFEKTYDSQLPSLVADNRKNSIPNIQTTIESNITVQKRNGELDRTNIEPPEPVEKSEPKVNVLPTITNGCREEHKELPTAITATSVSENSNCEKETKSDPNSEPAQATIKKVKLKPKADKKDIKPKKLKATATTTVIETPVLNVNNIDMVTQLTNEIESVTLPLPLQTAGKNTSKLIRPKSYPSKEIQIEKVDNKQLAETPEKPTVSQDTTTTQITVPIVSSQKPTTTNLKSNIKPAISAITSTRNSITGVVEKLIEKSAERLSPSKGMLRSKSKAESTGETTAVVKKKVKVIKKKSVDSTKSSDVASKVEGEKTKEKSPEKKPKTGFLYSIGQKLEKMRESTKSKEKKTVKSIEVTAPIECTASKPKENSPPAPAVNKQKPQTEPDDSKQFIPDVTQVIPSPAPQIKPDQRKTKIDTMIRNLRERSLTHTMAAENREGSAPPTESGLIKRAVSVEDMTNGMTSFNKCNVNKVLGMFKRIESEQQHQNMRDHLESVNSSNTLSNLNTDKQERPRSGGFVSKLKKARPYYTGAKSDTIVTLTDKFGKQLLAEKVNQQLAANSKLMQAKMMLNRTNCPDCYQQQPDENVYDINSDVTLKNCAPDFKRVSPQQLTTDKTTMRNSISNAPSSERDRIKNNRKGLVLDLNNAHLDHIIFENKINNNSNTGNTVNNNSTKYRLDQQYVENNNDNNGCCAPGDGQFEATKAISPNYELSTNYSSDSRSLHDDGASSSTFLSPTDDPDMYDNWSVYSGMSNDNQHMSPVCSKHTNYQSPRNSYYCNYQTRGSNSASKIPSGDTDPSSNPSDSESIIDRIKRRSFYCRFNEKKPKRTSSIVGPAAREYYRDIVTKPKHQANTTADSRAESCSRSKSATPINNKDIEPSSSFTHSSYINLMGNSPSHLSNYNHRYYHSTPITHSRSSSKTRHDAEDVRPSSSTKTNDYSSYRNSLASPSAHKTYSSAVPLIHSDYLLNGSGSRTAARTSLYDHNPSSTTPFLYASYNPKRRTSFYITPTSSSSSLLGNGSHHSSGRSSCATLTQPRKIRPYDHRSISLLDPNALTSCGLSADRRTSFEPHHCHQTRTANDCGSINIRSSLRNPSINKTASKNI